MFAARLRLCYHTALRRSRLERDSWLRQAKKHVMWKAEHRHSNTVAEIDCLVLCSTSLDSVVLLPTASIRCSQPPARELHRPLNTMRRQGVLGLLSVLLSSLLLASAEHQMRPGARESSPQPHLADSRGHSCLRRATAVLRLLLVQYTVVIEGNLQAISFEE